MRLPLAVDVESRDGVSNKDSRGYNILVEDDAGMKFSQVRPGLSTSGTATGNGNGLVDFNGYLISIYGTTAASSVALSSIGTVTDGFYDFVQSPL